MAEAKQIKALVVDDAAFMRKQLVEVLSNSDDIEVVAVARHGLEALEAIRSVHPDVITLDVDMPVMDGLTTIKHIMIKSPVPVVMVSGLADQGRITFEALRLGAIDFFPKPSGTISKDIKDKSNELVETLKMAARANPRAIKRAISRSKGLKSHSSARQMQGLVMVLARQGAVSSFIRMLTALEEQKNLGFVCVQDISETVLTAYGQELANIFDCVPYTGSRQKLAAQQCILVSELKLPKVRKRQESFSLELDGAESGGLSAFVSSIAELTGHRLCTVVLGGQVPSDTSFFSKILSSGGEVLALHPDKCVCSDLPRFIQDKGLGQIASNEPELWKRLQAFSRRLALENAKKVKNR